MKNYTFHFEIQTLIEQFIEAFNDVVIKRYDKNKSLIENSNINVKYIYAPKQRILETLTNPAPGGITLPAIAVNISSINRDEERIVNKIDGYNIPYIFSNSFDATKYLKHIPSPVPINIGISMNIFTKYQSDMDQILSNFLPYCDPYIVISWKMPFPDASDDNTYELRSEVLFQNNVQLSYPDTLAGNQLFRCTASCSFIIKGWIFKSNETIVPRVFTIDPQFTPTQKPSSTKYSLLKNIEDYYKGEEPGGSTNTPNLLAKPNLNTAYPWAFKPNNDFQHIRILGSGFNTTNQLYLSASFNLVDSENVNFFTDIPSLSASNPPFNGVLVSQEYYKIINDNIIEISIPTAELINNTGYLNFIFINEAGYGNLIENYNSNQANFAESINIPLEDLVMPITSGIQIF